MNRSRYAFNAFMLLVAISAASQYRNISLKSSITSVQPMTGIVLWTDNEENSTDAVQLEYSYMLYNSVVSKKSVYDWSAVDALLEKVASRKHQAILRFRFVYPGYETSVPDYIKQMAGYNETEGESEGRTTWFPDWTNEELQRFTLEFYSEFSERYDNDPRLAFIQTGFGLWAEYHIYDGPLEIGTTFPSKQFQADFFRHLDTVFATTPWSISIDAADDTYSPFEQLSDLKTIDFGLFDDSFMHEEHGGYNTDCWNFFGRERYLRSPAGGEFSYYTDFDQEHVLDAEGIHGTTWEEAAAAFHISYMIGNDQPGYQSAGRIRSAGMVSGYRFRINGFSASADSSIVEVENTGVAPVYYDTWVAVNGVRAKVSLKHLAPDSTLTCRIPAGGEAPELTIECDRLVDGQVIGFEADLDGSEAVTRRQPGVSSQRAGAGTVFRVYRPNGRLVRIFKGNTTGRISEGGPYSPCGVYIIVRETGGRVVAERMAVY
jgi:hypothetical protein